MLDEHLDSPNFLWPNSLHLTFSRSALSVPGLAPSFACATLYEAEHEAVQTAADQRLRRFSSVPQQRILTKDRFIWLIGYLCVAFARRRCLQAPEHFRQKSFSPKLLEKIPIFLLTSLVGCFYLLGLLLSLIFMFLFCSSQTTH